MKILKPKLKFNQNEKIIFACLFLFTCLSFSENIFAANLETQLDAINTLTTGKLKKYGISISTIAGGIWSLFKGNIKMTGVIVAIGVILGYYLSWIEGGMVIG